MVDNSIHQYQQVNIQVNTQPDPEATTSREELLVELRQQKVANDARMRVGEDALKRLEDKKAELSIRGTKATDHSKAFAGFINASAAGLERLEGRMEISDTTADGYSVAAAGVVNNVDLNISG